MVRGHLAYYAVPGKHRRGSGVSHPGDAALVQGASAPQPTHADQQDADAPHRYQMATARVLHPFRGDALRRQDPRQEPSALVALAGICA